MNDTRYLEEADTLQELEVTKKALASAMADVERLEEERLEILEGLLEAMGHLDYCGWGRDTWERECGKPTRDRLEELKSKYCQ